MIDDTMKEHEAQRKQMGKMMSGKKDNHEKMKKEFMKPAVVSAGPTLKSNKNKQ